MIKSDFHIHTTASDGLLTPKETVSRAIKNNLSYLAITDHDTVSGINEAISSAKDTNLTIIPGIELSTNFNNESIHILGYFKNDSYKSKEFEEILNELKNRRIHRAKEMVKKLNECFNIQINFKNVLKRGKDVVARPHIAAEIISSGYPYTFDYIFDNFIGKDKPAYVPANKLSIEEGISLLHKFNAIVFLAHPILINNSSLDKFLNFKLDGIEAVYYQNTKEDEKKLIDFANKNNLLISGGSDCHGNFVDDTRHGDIGDISMDEVYLNNFLKAIGYIK